MSYVVERAKAALEGVTPEPWDVRDGFIYPLAIRCGLGGIRPQDGEFIAAAPRLEAELRAEVERLRSDLDFYQEWSNDLAQYIPEEFDDDIAQEAIIENWAKFVSAEVGRLHTWDGLISLLDEHWPDDIFPTMEDSENRDPGPRIVSLIRWVEQLRGSVESLQKACKTLGEIITRANHMVLDATGAHDLIAEDGDGDWAAVWDRMAELCAEAQHLRGLQRDDRATAIAAIAERDAANAEVERLRAIVERVRALHYPVRDITDEYTCVAGCGDECSTLAALEADR